ncbi:HCNGP-like protein-domain-containing protein [Podospora didyma]|uniref:HCNGP-like protein-domain-containing protein n=1 Tax=Podospora didyma TaxID=330526 RepID=A0AAE0P3W1_9PEZI|nr:HCNGP-like protein-domain-containing protein [Podospora didyma]
MGLVQYESSDEDEEMQVEATQPLKQSNKALSSQSQKDAEPPSQKRTSIPPGTAQMLPPPPALASDKSASSSSGPEIGPIMGPTLGPTRPPPDAMTALPSEDVDMSFLEDISAVTEPPRSPYSASRALLRDLTLPAVPNMDIPPSPPGSPAPPGLDALNAKFDNFLNLKRTKGVHFNERVAASSALRNPALMDKLLGFVGIETDFVEGDAAAQQQYATTLPADVWDPHAFPEWAFRGPLRRAQEKGHKERERPHGEPIEFVPSASPAGGVGGGSVAGRPRKSRFDT